MVAEKGAKLLLVGCGKMGGAMLDGWLSRGLAAADAIVAEPVEALRPRKDGLRCVASSSASGPTGFPLACSIHRSGVTRPMVAMRWNSDPTFPAFSICSSI